MRIRFPEKAKGQSTLEYLIVLAMVMVILFLFLGYERPDAYGGGEWEMLQLENVYAEGWPGNWTYVPKQTFYNAYMKVLIHLGHTLKDMGLIVSSDML